MKARYVFMLIVGAAAAAALPYAGVRGQDRAALRAPVRVAAPEAGSGMLGILQHGAWQCTLPGDAGGAAFVEVPSEAFRIGTASSYDNPEGSGIYLLRGTELIFTRGPKKDQRFRVLGQNTLQKLNADGSPSKLFCTRFRSAGTGAN